MTADEAVAQQVANRILYVPTASGTAYHVNTPPAVVTALEYARQKGKRVRLGHGERKTASNRLQALNLRPVERGQDQPQRTRIDKDLRKATDNQLGT